METISIIIPCYNEEEAIPVYYETMVRQMNEMEEQQKVQFELIFVDDGSKDHSLFEMRRLAQKDMRCRYLSFSRNFGKEAAMYAGLQAAKGDYVTVMDVDLQDPPFLLPKMYAMLQSGTCDCVAARRSSREGEGKIKSFLSNAFYSVINRLRNPAGKDGIEKNCLPILPHVITAHLSPSDDQKDHHDQNDNAQLPAQAYHHNLQRNHQQNRIKVVEDCQYLHLLVYPRRFQPCRRQHCKQYTG